MAQVFQWYAIDAEDSVAVFSSGTTGTVPDALQVPPGDRWYAFEWPRTTEPVFDLAGFEAWYAAEEDKPSDLVLRHTGHGPRVVFLRSPAPLARELASGFCRPLAASEGTAVYFPELPDALWERLHLQGECLGCFDCSLKRNKVGDESTSNPERAARAGVYWYEVVHDLQGEPYGRLAFPREPVKLAALSPELRQIFDREGLRLPVSFRTSPAVQPADPLPVYDRLGSRVYVSAFTRHHRNHAYSGIAEDEEPPAPPRSTPSGFIAADRAGRMALFLSEARGVFPADAGAVTKRRVPLEPAKAAADGHYVYAGGGEGRPFERVAVPEKPLIPALESKSERGRLLRKAVYLPVDFANAPRVQPADHVPCLGEGKYHSLSGDLYDLTAPRWQPPRPPAQPAPPKYTGPKPAWLVLRSISTEEARDGHYHLRLDEADGLTFAEAVQDKLMKSGIPLMLVVAGTLPTLVMRSDSASWSVGRRSYILHVSPALADELFGRALDADGSLRELQQLPGLWFGRR